MLDIDVPQQCSGTALLHYTATCPEVQRMRRKADDFKRGMLGKKRIEGERRGALEVRGKVCKRNKANSIA